MGDSVDKATNSLLEFGILGVFCIIFIGAIVYLFRYMKMKDAESMKVILKSKDQQLQEKNDEIKDLKEIVRNITENMEVLSRNVDKLVTLYPTLSQSIDKIPEMVALKIK